MSTDPKTINSYNQFAPRFQEELRTGFHHPYIEKPAMQKMLGDVKGKRILCLGSGTGEEVDCLTKQGAKVIGIDLSEGMINQARKHFPDLDFQIMDMHNLDFPANSFDLVYSSLAIQYVSDLEKLFSDVNKLLIPRGIFQFSSTHPYFERPGEEINGGWKYQVVGQAKNLTSKKKKYFGQYFVEGPTEHFWWDEQFPVIFYHRTLETIIKGFLDNGFILIDYGEPQPLHESKDLFPEKYEEYTCRPGFVIFKCQKK